jgi:hypothetical protein
MGIGIEKIFITVSVLRWVCVSRAIPLGRLPGDRYQNNICAHTFHGLEIVLLTIMA